jgi:hypothetical protein
MTQAISFGPLKKFNDGYQREAYPHALFYFLSVQNSTLARPGTLDHGTCRRLPPRAMLIRVSMRTAVRKKVTSFGTFPEHTVS